MLESICRMPPRYGLLGDMVEGRAQVIRTLGLPYDEARIRAERCPSDVRDALTRGRFGRTWQELLPAEVTRTTTQPTVVEVAASTESSSSPMRRRPSKRPALEFPQ